MRKRLVRPAAGSVVAASGRRNAVALIAALLLASAHAWASALPADDGWSNFGRDGSEQHYSPLDEISVESIDELQLAWHFDLKPGFSLSTPVQAEGKLFITTGHSHIRALDAVTGKLLWEFDAKVREIAQSALHLSWEDKGLACWTGRVFSTAR